MTTRVFMSTTLLLAAAAAGQEFLFLARADELNARLSALQRHNTEVIEILDAAERAYAGAQGPPYLLCTIMLPPGSTQKSLSMTYAQIRPTRVQTFATASSSYSTTSSYAYLHYAASGTRSSDPELSTEAYSSLWYSPSARTSLVYKEDLGTSSSWLPVRVDAFWSKMADCRPVTGRDPEEPRAPIEPLVPRDSPYEPEEVSVSICYVPGEPMESGELYLRGKSMDLWVSEPAAVAESGGEKMCATISVHPGEELTVNAMFQGSDHVVQYAAYNRTCASIEWQGTLYVDGEIVEPTAEPWGGYDGSQWASRPCGTGGDAKFRVPAPR